MGMTITASLLDDLRYFLSAADDPSAREIWNGAWFALGTAMVFSFMLIAVQRIYNKRRKVGWVFRDTVFQLALALCTFSAASSLRAAYIWLLLHCENLYGVNQCPAVERLAGALSVGAIVAIISGVLIIRLLAPPEWNPWIWIAAALTAVSGPIVFYVATRALNFSSSELAVIEGRYDPFLVVVSILVAIFAAYVALELIWHSREMIGERSSWLWTMLAAVAMGGGIWSMHFIAMLSFTLPGMLISYDVLLTTLSLVIPIVVTLVGFLAIKDYASSIIPLVVAGLFISAGIVTMHYTGMAAMRMPFANMTYDPILFSLSVLIAVVASIASVWIAFSGDVGDTTLDRKVLAAIIGGIAVSGMHYTGMAATTFYMTPQGMSGNVAATDHTGLALWVTATSIIILAAFIGALFYVRRRGVVS